MEGFDALQELRVLNLAGNKLRCDLFLVVVYPAFRKWKCVNDPTPTASCMPCRMVENVSCLTALTELNLRRNTIKKVRRDRIYIYIYIYILYIYICVCVCVCVYCMYNLQY